MEPRSRVLVAGGDTMLGRALITRLHEAGYAPLSSEPDLRDPVAVEQFFRDARPEYVFVAAGMSAGIVGNQRAPADLMIDSLRIATSVVPPAWEYKVKKLLYLGSSCMYPRTAPQPLDVATLGTGELEPSSSAYATAKLAGMKLCEAYRRQHGAPFITAVPADAYGPHDDLDPMNAHVVGALLVRMHEARLAGAETVDVWGSGTPRREFIYVDDLADACLCVMQNYNDDRPLNLGIGTSTSIADLARAVRDAVGYQGVLRFDTSKPDGMPFKGLDSTVLQSLGWRPKVELTEGLRRTYAWLRSELNG